eukprot:15467890-Alexandrium_andersonii.AAC.1
MWPYHIADKCPKQWSVPSRLERGPPLNESTWAIPCPACQGNHVALKCDMYRQLVDLGKAPLMCEWCGGG